MAKHKLKKKLKVRSGKRILGYIEPVKHHAKRQVRMYRLKSGDGRVSKTIPSLAGAYRLAEQVDNLPFGTIVEVSDNDEWRRIGPAPRSAKDRS